MTTKTITLTITAQVTDAEDFDPCVVTELVKDLAMHGINNDASMAELCNDSIKEDILDNLTQFEITNVI